MKRKWLNSGFIAMLMTLHLAMIACNNNPTGTEKQEVPSLPPAESMQIDISLFTGQHQAGKAAVLSGQNFNQAAARVLVINTLVVLTLSLPIAALVAAASQQPKFESDGKFHWTYTVHQGATVAEADLAGWIDTPNQESVWEMRITNNRSNPPLDHFLWYKGRASLVDHQGYWDVYDATHPENSPKALRIDWSQPSQDQSTVKFTVVLPGIPQNGDQITYAANGNDRSIRYFDNSAAQTMEVAWDAQTGAGYLLAPNYNNGEKACWDAQGNDVTCPGN